MLEWNGRRQSKARKTIAAVMKGKGKRHHSLTPAAAPSQQWQLTSFFRPRSSEAPDVLSTSNWVPVPASKLLCSNNLSLFLLFPLPGMGAAARRFCVTSVSCLTFPVLQCPLNQLFALNRI